MRLSASAIEVFHAVGHRRVDGVLAAFGLELPVARRGRPALRAGVIVLGERDQLGEQRDFVLDVDAPAEDHLDDLVEIEQPERQPQIAGPHHVGAVLEAGGIFVVRIDQQDAQLAAAPAMISRRISATPLDLPAPVEPKIAKCLLHHVVDVDIGADRSVLLQMADIDRVRARGRRR